MALFFEILSKFLNIKYDELIIFFKKKSEEEEFIKIKDAIEYCKPICFLSDSSIKFEESIKKKPPYLKLKTIPKWHYHALDLIRYYNIIIIIILLIKIK